MLGCSGPRGVVADPGPAPPSSAAASGATFDSSAVDAFGQLGPSDLAHIARRRVYFEHASVGANILDGLRQVFPTLKIQSVGSSLQGAQWLAFNFGLAENNRGNPGCWQKAKIFGQCAAMPAGTILMMKLCYIDDDNDTKGLFIAYRDAVNHVALRNPDSTCVWWTMPLQTSGNAKRKAYNQMVRTYCREHRLPLFDIASVEADGGSGDMNPAYSSDGGHLNGEGQKRVAKALCVMLARL